MRESTQSSAIGNLLAPTDAPRPRERIVAIDALRGLVIVLMALDHSRDFFGDIRIRPEAIDTTTISLFFTRWFTHFCAPTFVFLAGVSAWMHGQKLDSRRELAWFLISRGLWLLFLEFTVIRFGIFFSISIGPSFFIVIAAIGSSMLLLGLLCRLPTQVVLAIGLVIVCGHNMLDGIESDQLGGVGWIWTLLHQPGFIQWANMAVGYPILPWFGVMAIGYGISPYLASSVSERRRFAIVVGLAFVVAFLLLRTVNRYGDSQRWQWQPVSAKTVDGLDQDVTAEENATSTVPVEVDWTRTMFSFLATSKYPPSLLFVLMTIGPALLILAVLDWLGKENPVVRFLNIYGRVPLFFYVLHFYVLNLAAWALYWCCKGVLISPMEVDITGEFPPEYGFNGPGWLVQVYVGWALLLAVLYPLCYWFWRVKRRGKSRFWSYL